MATVTVYPTDDGATTQWTPSSGVDNYALINEVGAPNDSTKVTVASDAKVDEYLLGQVASTIDRITSVVINLRIKGTASPADPALKAELVINGGSVVSFTGGVDTSGAFTNFSFTSQTLNILRNTWNAGNPTLRITSINNSLGGGVKYPDWVES